MTLPLARRLAAESGGHVIIRGLGLVVEFAGWLLLARQLGPGPFGRLAIAFAICRYLAILADWGASTSGPRDVARGDADRVDTLASWRRVLGTGLTAAIVVAFLLTGNLDLTPIAAVVLARSFNLDWVLLGRGRPLSAGASSGVQGVLLSVGAILAHDASGGAWAIGVAYAGGSVVSAALAGPGKQLFRRLPMPAPWLLVAALAGQLMLELDVVLLGPLAGTEAAGMYAAVYRLPNAVNTAVGLILVATLPAASRLLHRPEAELHAIRRRALRVSGSAGLIVAVVGASLTAVTVRATLGGRV